MYQIWSLERTQIEKNVSDGGRMWLVAKGNIASTVSIYVAPKQRQEVEELELHGHRPHMLENYYLVRNHMRVS